LIRVNNLVDAFRYISDHEVIKSIQKERLPGTEKYATDPLNIENLAILSWFAEEETDRVCVDLGCGTGVATILLSHRHPYVIGFDGNLAALNVAKRLRDYQEHEANVDFVLVDLNKLPLRNAKVDLAICSHVLEHLNQPHLLLAGARRILSEKGILIISIPTILWELQFLLSRGKTMLLGHRPWNPQDLSSDFHIHKWPPWRWENLLKKAGFTIYASRGYYFLPIRRMSQFLTFFLWWEDRLFDKFPWRYLGLGLAMKTVKAQSLRRSL